MEGVKASPAKVGKTGWRWPDDEPIGLVRRDRLGDPEGDGRGPGRTSSSSTRARSCASPRPRSCSGGLEPAARLLIAGDDKQLPPIIQAAYPDPRTGRAAPAPVDLRMPQGAGPRRRFTATLLENWRMSRTLCLYPAEQIYTPELPQRDATRSPRDGWRWQGRRSATSWPTPCSTRITRWWSACSTASGRRPRTASRPAWSRAPPSGSASGSSSATPQVPRHAPGRRRVLEGRAVHRQPAPRRRSGDPPRPDDRPRLARAPVRRHR